MTAERATGRPSAFFTNPWIGVPPRGAPSPVEANAARCCGAAEGAGAGAMAGASAWSPSAVLGAPTRAGSSSAVLSKESLALWATAAAGAVAGVESSPDSARSVPDLLRSATSLMNSVRMKASSAHGAAYRKTSPTPCPYALSMMVRKGAGSWDRSGMPPPPVPPWPRAAPLGPRSATPSWT